MCRWSDAVYFRLRGAIAARTAGRRHVIAGSRVPCRIDVLTLLVERLHRLAGHGWRPQDYELLSGYCVVIEWWVIAVAELRGDRQVAVRACLWSPITDTTGTG